MTTNPRITAAQLRLVGQARDKLDEALALLRELETSGDMHEEDAAVARDAERHITSAFDLLGEVEYAEEDLDAALA